MTATNGKANGHDRPPFAEPIREQGPKTYEVMRERIERQKAAEAQVRTVEGKPLDIVQAPPPGSTKPPRCSAGHVAKPGEPCPVCLPVSLSVAQALAGRPADATLPAGTGPRCFCSGRGFDAGHVEGLP